MGQGRKLIFRNTSSRDSRRVHLAENGQTALFVFIVFAALVAFLSGGYTTFPDSASYLNVDGSWGFSLLGNSYRPWPIVAIYGPGVRVGVITQYLFFTVSVCFLLLAVNASSKSAIRWRLLPLILISAAVLSPYFMQWNSAVLSESLTHSLVMTSFAALVCYQVQQKPGWAYFAILSSGLALVIKPYLVFFPLAIAIAGLISTREKHLRRGVVARLVVLVILVSFYGVYVQSNTNDYWATRESGLNRSGLSFVYLTGTNSGSTLPDQLYQGLQADQSVPKCITSVRSDFVESPFFFQDNLAEACPEDIRWINKHFQTWYFSFVFQNPRYMIQLIDERLDGTESISPTYTRPINVIPKPITKIFFSSSERPIRFSPVFQMLFGLILVFALKVRGRFAQSPSLSNVVSAVVLYCAGLTSLILAHLMMNSELQRLSTGGYLICLLGFMLGAKELLMDSASIQSQGA